jgi:hypothetical protein
MIVCLCGSTKYKEEFLAANKQFTLKGYVVLSVGFYGHADDAPPDRFTKAKLDLLHLEKIELSDAIYVLNCDGYIGESTEREIVHAIKRDKAVLFYDEKAGKKYLEERGAKWKDHRWTL